MLVNQAVCHLGSSKGLQQADHFWKSQDRPDCVALMLFQIVSFWSSKGLQGIDNFWNFQELHLDSPSCSSWALNITKVACTHRANKRESQETKLDTDPAETLPHQYKKNKFEYLFVIRKKK